MPPGASEPAGQRREEAQGRDRPGHRSAPAAARRCRRRCRDRVVAAPPREHVVEHDPRVGGGVEPVPRLALQAAPEQPPHRRRRAGRESREVDVGAQHGGQRVAHGLAVEESPPGEHLVEYDAEGPDVRPFVYSAAARLLGRHVAGRAEDGAELRAVGGQRRRASQVRPPLRARRGLHRLGQPEVEHLDRAVRAHLHVRGLEVAMHDPLLVGRLERLGDLPSDRQRLVERKRTARDARREVLALHELHHQRARPVRLLEAVNRRDVGVVQRSQGLRLALEAREALAVGGKRRRQHLDRHLATQPRVGGAPHLPHPALAQLGADLVGAEASAHHRAPPITASPRRRRACRRRGGRRTRRPSRRRRT